MGRKNVFVIGATNRPDILDPAVIRPGRLDQLIYIPLPDLESRLSIFKAALRKSPVANDIDFRVLARSTSGFSGADIKEVCIAASKCAIHDYITRRDQKQQSHVYNIRGSLIRKSIEYDELFITKKHMNTAMSNARRSVSDQDLALFEEFCHKQK